MRRAGSEIVARAETIRQANQEAARDPAQVLATLTRNNATFTERELDRHLTKQFGPARTTLIVLRKSHKNISLCWVLPIILPVRQGR